MVYTPLSTATLHSHSRTLALALSHSLTLIPQPSLSHPLFLTLTLSLLTPYILPQANPTASTLSLSNGTAHPLLYPLTL